MEEADVIHAAYALSALYAGGAVRRALVRPLELLERGDNVGCENWRRVAVTITELESRVARAQK